MDLKKFKKLLQKHHIIPKLLQDPHAISKMPKEVQQMLEDIIRDYPAETIQSITPVSGNNRRTLVVQELLHRLKQVE